MNIAATIQNEEVQVFRPYCFTVDISTLMDAEYNLQNYLCRIWQGSAPNFGQAKHSQNGPAATVCQQCICCPICGHHFTHWTHPDISLPFRAGGRRLKNFRFSRICVTPWWKSSSACCGLNFDATDLPNSLFALQHPPKSVRQVVHD